MFGDSFFDSWSDDHMAIRHCWLWSHCHQTPLTIYIYIYIYIYGKNRKNKVIQRRWIYFERKSFINFGLLCFSIFSILLDYFPLFTWIKNENITTKFVVFHLFLSSCQIHQNKQSLSLSLSLSLYIYIYIYILRVHTWNSSPLRSNHFRLQSTCCTVPTTPGRSH